jgi:hypothetical protein
MSPHVTLLRSYQNAERALRAVELAAFHARRELASEIRGALERDDTWPTGLKQEMQALLFEIDPPKRRV